MDLLNDFELLSARLRVELEHQRWLDAFLLAAGTSQILDDHRRRWGATMRRGVTFLRSCDAPGTTTLAAVTRTAATTLDRLAGLLASGRALENHRVALTALTAALASLVLGGDAARISWARKRADRAKADWTSTLAETPAELQSQVLRLPACFRSMDQHPEDMRALARRFALRRPDRTKPLVVVGVRTSGSYLAPLCAAALSELGYQEVAELTVRPGDPLLRGESEAVREVARGGGLALVLDDPPVTGASIAAVAEQLEREGLPAAAIVAVLARTDERPAPLPVLGRYAQVSLNGPDWHIARVLRPDRVAEALRRVLPPTDELLRLETRAPAADTPTPGRGHVEASYTAQLLDHVTGSTVRRDLVAEGVGVGYLGRHAVAVAGALPGWVPVVHGFADGLLIREATSARPGPGRDLTPFEDADRLGEHVVGYVLARHRALPAVADTSMRVAGHSPAWELAAAQLCGVLGRLGLPLRIPLVDPIMRRLLTVTSPMIVDGRMSPQRWRLADPGPDGVAERIVKETFAEGAFSNRELFSYDPVFDLAGASVQADCGRFTARLREGYEARTATPISEERWLVHRMAHLQAEAESGRMPAAAVHRRRALAIQRYFASHYLDDVTSDPDGPLCALDIDGVLEISPLGCPMTTRAGALALRSLLAHGYRPLLATGRHLEDVQERCETYGLRGGVAEYGALTYDHDTGAVVELVDEREQDDLARLREALVTVPGVSLDPSRRLTVRACRGTPDDRRGMPPAAVEAAMVAADVVERVRVIPGEGQTDFVPAAVDKSTGLRSLLESLRVPATARPLALAVGDAAADAGMLAMAEVARAPSNAEPGLVRHGVRRTRASYQAGLAQAVGSLLGHPPGACCLCRAPARPRETRALVALLSVTEAGRLGVPSRLLCLAGHAAGARWLR
ncbi:MAG TPA: hypothetical protein VGH76_10765 [Actinomycetospora sp.]|uniref:hypothetical protein n=1 Tax=Actinomycetospora sp. TaxID=1872135 RepID=UPI002F41DE75